MVGFTGGKGVGGLELGPSQGLASNEAFVVASCAHCKGMAG